MKVLITGANGFIGSNLVKRLVYDDICVDIIKRSESNLDSLSDVLNKISVFNHDGSTKNMMSILKSSKPDVVCHLAGIASYNYDLDDIEPLINSNILFGNQLVECMIRNDIYKLINTGTYWQHYQNIEYNPTCLYAATKQAFIDILKFYVESYNLNVITLKLYDNYGPNDNRNKLFNFINKSVENNELINLSPGDQLIDIVYISDLIDAYLLSIKRLGLSKNKGYNEFFISTNKPISLRNLVDKYLNLTNQKANIKWGARTHREREIMVPFAKGKRLPGWVPKISIDDGIKLMSEIDNNLL